MRWRGQGRDRVRARPFTGGHRPDDGSSCRQNRDRGPVPPCVGLPARSRSKLTFATITRDGEIVREENSIVMLMCLFRPAVPAGWHCAAARPGGADGLQLSVLCLMSALYHICILCLLRFVKESATLLRPGAVWTALGRAQFAPLARVDPAL